MLVVGGEQEEGLDQTGGSETDRGRAPGMGKLGFRHSISNTNIHGEAECELTPSIEHCQFFPCFPRTPRFFFFSYVVCYARVCLAPDCLLSN